MSQGKAISSKTNRPSAILFKLFANMFLTPFYSPVGKGRGLPSIPPGLK
jgi:hypothetical protein